MDEQREWWEHVIDALEVTNMEHQAAHAQFAGMCQALKYIAEAVYHHFIVGSKASTKGPDGWGTKGLRVGRCRRLVWGPARYQAGR